MADPYPVEKDSTSCRVLSQGDNCRFSPQHVDLLAKYQNFRLKPRSRNSPVSAYPSSKRKSIIVHEHHPIRASAPPVWGFRQGQVFYFEIGEILG